MEQYNSNDYYGNSVDSNAGGFTGSDFMEGNAGFEGGNPVVKTFHDVKSVLCQEVVAKAYLFMVAALLITAYAAFTTTPKVAIRLLTGYNFYILFGAELAIVLVSNWAVKKNNAVLAGVLYAVYSYLTGVTFSVIFRIFTLSSVAIVFLLTAGMFAIMAVYGMVTKKDLTKFGNILLMGLIGIILASVVNIFMGSNTVDMVISIVSIVTFVGLTAYDTQKIKRMVEYADNSNVLTLALYGAFELYLDFINLFLEILKILGRKKD